MPNIFSSVLFFRKPSCNDDVTGGGPREAPIVYLSIYPVFMQLLGYGQGITMIIPSDISPDMFGTRSEEDGQGQKVLIIKLHPEDFN